MESKPLVLLMVHDEFQAVQKTLQATVNLQHRPGFVSVQETPLSEDDYANVEAIVVNTRANVNKDLLDRCPKLRVVVRDGVGIDRIDARYAATIGVGVCNVPEYGTEEVADSAVSHMLNLFRQTTQFHNEMQSGTEFSNILELKAVGKAVRRIRGKTLGLIGVGKIGNAVAERAKAFGMNVIFYDPYVPEGFDKAHAMERVPSVEDVAKRSDCVSLHCALTPETKHIVNESVLRMFKKEAFLINVSRGGLVDETALAQALREGGIAGAGIDVFFA